MDDNYLDEVLPRWQFLKEYLIEQLERYTERFEGKNVNFDLSDKEIEKIKKINKEMIEKIKGIKSRTVFEEIADEIMMWREWMVGICGLKDYNYAGAFFDDVTDEYKLSSWLNIENLAYAMYRETNKEITK